MLETKSKRGFNLNNFYSKIYKRYDFINKLFTFGLDKKWRKVTVEECLKGKPKAILDLCCGTGDIALALNKVADNGTSITGFDMNASMLHIAEQKASKFNAPSLIFQQGDAGDMPFENESFDRISIGFGFRNLTFENRNKETHLTEMFRVLKPKGKLLILESSVPENFIIRIFYLIHLYAILIPLGGLLSGDFKAYWYLAHSSAKFYSSTEIAAMLKKAGFKKCTFRKFLFGAANLIIADK